MGIAFALLLVAAGAILIWGVETSVSGLDVDAIGAILMVVGIVGAALSLAFWPPWGDSRTVVEERRRP